MKNIDLEYYKKNDLYHVGVGFSKTMHFENKTQAEKFIRQYKKNIQDNILALNALQPQINALYRQNIIQLDSFTLNDCQLCLKNFDDAFLKVFETYSSGNRSGFVHTHISNCFTYLENCINSLLSYAHKNKNYGLKTALNPIQSYFNLIEKDFSENREKVVYDKN